jgi:hypothetical protein
MTDIPQQLEDDTYLLRVRSPKSDCESPGKQPIGSAKTGPFYTGFDPELLTHIRNGGNVGKALKGPLVVFDVDHQEFASEISSSLPPTFVVESGGSGFGQHWYYHCPEWDKNRQFKIKGTDYGSLRTGNWQVVIPPSVHAESGDRYQVHSDRLISSVGVHEIENLISGIPEGRTANTPGGGGGGCVGRLREVPTEYPQKPVNWQTMKDWIESNQLLSELSKTASNDWSGLEFKLCKCLAEGGFSESSITGALDRLSPKSKWHRRGTDYRKRTVRKAVLAACEDEYVNFEFDDMEVSKTSESRKTEDSGGSRTLSGGDNQMDYNTLENLTVYNADSVEEAEDGDRVIRVEVTNMSGRGDDGEPVDTDFVTVTKGTLRQNGDFGVSPEFPGQSKSVGSADPEDLRLIASGLEEVANGIEE